LSEDLAERGCANIRLAELHAATRDLLRAENLEAKVGAIDRFTSVADVVERFVVEGERESRQIYRNVTEP
jgi:hypothetical protein